MKKFLPKTNSSGGYAVIFSVVVVSVVIIVTLAISSIIQRELELSSIGQQSMEAFFAADAGIECALYWDISEREQAVFRGSPRNITCAGQTSSIRSVSGNGTASNQEFRIDGDFCAIVRIEISGTNTLVKSSGFNTCDAGPGQIERGLEVRY